MDLTCKICGLLCTHACICACVFKEAATVHTCAYVTTLRPVLVQLMHETKAAPLLKDLLHTRFLIFVELNTLLTKVLQQLITFSSNK